MLYYRLEITMRSTRERISVSNRSIAMTKSLVRETARRIHTSRLATGHVAAPREHIAFEQLWPNTAREQMD